jgi:hypothetical protein
MLPVRVSIYPDSLRIPVGMRRPAPTRKALRLNPLMEASGAHSSRIKGVPLMPAGARPELVLTGRPAAEWASDTRAGRVEAFLVIWLAIQDNRLVMREGAHASYYDVVSVQEP